jgi:formamidopyrimidine-DNA glycosylase
LPELPDIEIYVEALRERVVGSHLEDVHLLVPFLLRTVSPSPDEARGRQVVAVHRLGKRIAILYEEDLWFVFHLMVGGRLHWLEPASRSRRRGSLAVFRYSTGTLLLTEAGSKRRASLHVVAGPAALAAFDRGGLEIGTASRTEFVRRLLAENHTLKRALTDPRILSGIGNAYSDEILHRARLAPTALTQRLTDDEFTRLYEAARSVLAEWTSRLRLAAVGRFPDKVTAFRDGMSVHGRYGQPCPVCATAVQRIRYAENETNYCPRCQTGGKLLSDRALARLLKSDWPRTIDELEKRQPARGD